LEKGDVVALMGDLGSGKTTFVKGLADGVGVSPEHVNSPSFVICQEFEGRLPLYHFDLHRMTGETDLLRLESEVGLADYVDGEGVCVIEWADRATALLPPEHLEIRFSIVNEETRQLSFDPKGERYQGKVSQL